VVEGGGLENRCAERYRGFESYSLRQRISIRRGDREAEGARLLSECMLKGVPWVRIPPSPPGDYFLSLPVKAGIFLGGISIYDAKFSFHIGVSN
jgi:hypothetical protein